MARRIKVPVPGSAGKFMFLDADATAGAAVGVNLTLDGRVLRPDEILNSAVQAGDVIFQGGFDGGGPGGDLTTDAVTEAGNLYFTDPRAQDAAGAVLDGTGDVPLTYGTGPRKISAALSATGVAAGSYGDSTHYATFTVDSKGRLTAAGQVTAAAGSIATDTIWTAKGDLAVGIGSHTAAVIHVGANGRYLIADSAQAAGVRWSTVSDTANNGRFNAYYDSNHWASMIATSATAGALFMYAFGDQPNVLEWGAYDVNIMRRFTLSGIISPAQITASQADYSPTDLLASSVMRLDLDAPHTVSGIDATGSSDGRILVVHNVSAFGLTLSNQGAGSSAANRLILPGGTDLVIPADGCAALQYDGTASRWRAVSTPGSGIQFQSDTLATPGAGTATFETTNPIDNFEITYRAGATRYRVFPDECTVIDSTHVSITALATGDYLFEYWTRDMAALGSTTVVGVLPAVTWNILDKSPDITLSGGALIATQTAGTSRWSSVRGTDFVDAATANDYFEVELTSASTNIIIGIGNASASVALTAYVGADTNSLGYYTTIGVIFYNNGNYVTGLSSYNGTGHVVGVLLKNGNLYVSTNGAWENSGDPVAETGYVFSGLTGDYYPMACLFENSRTMAARFAVADLANLPSGSSAWAR